MPSLVVRVKRSTPASYFVRLKKRAKKVIVPVLQAGTQLPHESKLAIVRHCEAEFGRHCEVSTSFPRSVKRVETRERVKYRD